MLSVLATLSAASAQQPFTLQQALSAPYSTSLTAAPKGALFAWVEDAEGRHNLWVGGPETPARQLTHNTQDDAQDIAQLAWSPDAESIAYTYGAEIGASGQPANPAHLQRPTALQVIVQSLGKKTAPISIPNARRPFFLDTHTLLFLREGKIWTTELTSNPSPHQLVYDRGSASSLTLSPDGKLLAYVSTRRQSGHPSHSYIALYDLSAHTLRFVSPATDVDSAPAFSPDGKQLAWLRRPFTETLEFATDRVSAMPWSIQLCDLATNTTHTLYSPQPNKYGSVLPRMATGDPYLMWSTIPSAIRLVKQDHRPKDQQQNNEQAHLELASFQTANPADEPPPHHAWLLFFSEADGYVHLYGIDPAKPGSQPTEYAAPKSEAGTNYEVDRKSVV